MHAAKTLGWAGATPLLTAFSRPKARWGRSRPVTQEGDRVLAACRSGESRRIAGSRHKPDYGGREAPMAIIKAPPKQPKSVTYKLRVEETVRGQLDQICEVHRLLTLIRRRLRH